MPDDHSESVPPLPIPNRTVKRLCADDSAATSVKVGHRQALTLKSPLKSQRAFFYSSKIPAIPAIPVPPPRIFKSSYSPHHAQLGKPYNWAAFATSFQANLSLHHRDFQDLIMQKVFITGASSGIGAALARQYAQQGALVGLAGRRESALELLRCSLHQPDTHQTYVLDVNNPADLHAAAQDFIDRHGAIDIVIACAGVSVGTLTSEPLDAGEFANVFNTNVLGTVNTFAAFIGQMLKQAKTDRTGDLRLVAMSSVASIRGLPGGGAYSASKAAVTTYCESLRVELQGSGIEVVTILPGYIDTPMTQVNHYRMPFLMPAPAFATAASAHIRRGSSYCVIPWQMGVVAKILRIMPNALFDRAFKRAPRKARSISKK
jgi:short-subunit dehydrogenase